MTTVEVMRDKRTTSETDPPPGLRERKKIKTRAAIRREAFRLIEDQGYANTTVEQIADAADVSSSTFFRYFPAKEAVLLSDDLTEPVVDAFIAAPNELSPVAAYQYAVAATFNAMTTAEREDAIAGQRLLYSVPEARGLIYSEYIRLIGLITDALEIRLEKPSDEFERRMIAGAITGVLIATSDGTPMPENPIARGLSFLDAGMPLR
jgi:AcrR family transcriptional regulator